MRAFAFPAERKLDSAVLQYLLATQRITCCCLVESDSNSTSLIMSCNVRKGRSSSEVSPEANQTDVEGDLFWTFDDNLEVTRQESFILGQFYGIRNL